MLKPTDKNEKESSLNEKDFKEDMYGDDLDFPEQELDEQQENLANEGKKNQFS
jgi:hypothetical protein